LRIDWTKITKIVDETSDIKTFYLEVPEDFTWEEGSYTHMALKGFNEGEKPNRGLVRHMSICTLPNENTIGITTRIRELCSEYKERLKTIKVGDKVALFKTLTNVPLRRENKIIYLLSAGVGLATLRPLALSYLENQEDINHVHSLNIDTSKEYLFTDLFQTDESKNFTAEYVDDRKKYYERVSQLAEDKESIFYIVGSDEYIKENIELLLKNGISQEQISLDKHDSELPEFFPEKKAM